MASSILGSRDRFDHDHDRLLDPKGHVIEVPAIAWPARVRLWLSRPTGPDVRLQRRTLGNNLTCDDPPLAGKLFGGGPQLLLVTKFQPPVELVDENMQRLSGHLILYQSPANLHLHVVNL